MLQVKVLNIKWLFLGLHGAIDVYGAILLHENGKFVFALQTNFTICSANSFAVIPFLYCICLPDKPHLMELYDGSQTPWEFGRVEAAI